MVDLVEILAYQCLGFQDCSSERKVVVEVQLVEQRPLQQAVLLLVVQVKFQILDLCKKQILLGKTVDLLMFRCLLSVV